MYLTTIKTKTQELKFASKDQVYIKVEGDFLSVYEYLEVEDMSIPLNTLKAVVHADELLYMDCNNEMPELTTGVAIHEVEVDIDKMAERLLDKMKQVVMLC